MFAFRDEMEVDPLEPLPGVSSRDEGSGPAVRISDNPKVASKRQRRNRNIIRFRGTDEERQTRETLRSDKLDSTALGNFQNAHNQRANKTILRGPWGGLVYTRHVEAAYKVADELLNDPNYRDFLDETAQSTHVFTARSSIQKKDGRPETFGGGGVGVPLGRDETSPPPPRCSNSYLNARYPDMRHSRRVSSRSRSPRRQRSPTKSHFRTRSRSPPRPRSRRPRSRSPPRPRSRRPRSPSPPRPRSRRPRSPSPSYSRPQSRLQPYDAYSPVPRQSAPSEFRQVVPEGRVGVPPGRDETSLRPPSRVSRFDWDVYNSDDDEKVMNPNYQYNSDDEYEDMIDSNYGRRSKKKGPMASIPGRFVVPRFMSDRKKLRLIEPNTTYIANDLEWVNYAKSHALYHQNGQIYEIGLSAFIMTPDILANVIADEAYVPPSQYRHFCISEHRRYKPFVRDASKDFSRGESHLAKPIWIDRSQMGEKLRAFVDNVHELAPQNNIVFVYHNMQAEVDSYERNGLTGVFRDHYNNAIDTQILYDYVQGGKGTKTLGGLYRRFCAGLKQNLKFHNPLDDAFATQALVLSFIREKNDWLKTLK